MTLKKPDDSERTFNVDELNRMESRLGVSGRLESQTLVADFIRQESLDFNGYQCAAQAIVQQLGALLQLRAFLARGDIEQGMILLRSQEDLFASDTGVSDLKIEFHIEAARLAVQSVDYDLALNHISLALNLDPIPLSRLTLGQMKCHVLFEIGRHAEAWDVVQAYVPLARVYEYSPSALYLKILEIKLLARRLGTDTANRSLYSTLRQTLVDIEGPNLNKLLTLLRLKIDLSKLEDRPCLEESLACFYICRLLGDELYEGLAFAEMTLSLSEAARTPFTNQLTHYKVKFKKVAKLFDQPVLSESKRILRPTDIVDPLENQISLYFADLGLFLSSLSDREKAVDLDKSPKMAKLASALATSSSWNKSELFETIWNQRYVPHLHEAVLKNLLSRCRKLLKLNLKVVNARISLQDQVVIAV